MNRDQLKGAAKQASGKLQKETGKLTGDLGTRMRGHAASTEGKLQKNVGDAKEVVRNNQRELDRTRGRKRSV